MAKTYYVKILHEAKIISFEQRVFSSEVEKTSKIIYHGKAK